MPSTSLILTWAIWEMRVNTGRQSIEMGEKWWHNKPPWLRGDPVPKRSQNLLTEKQILFTAFSRQDRPCLALSFAPLQTAGCQFFVYFNPRQRISSSVQLHVVSAIIYFPKQQTLFSFLHKYLWHMPIGHFATNNDIQISRLVVLQHMCRPFVFLFISLAHTWVEATDCLHQKSHGQKHCSQKCFKLTNNLFNQANEWGEFFLYYTTWVAGWGEEQPRCLDSSPCKNKRPA